MRTLVFAPIIAAFAAIGVSQDAMAETKRYYCGEESFVTVDTIDAETISAGLIGGKTITLGQLPNTNRYAFGNTTIEVLADGGSILIQQGEGEAIGCVFPVPADVVTPGGANATIQAQSAPGAKPDTTVRNETPAIAETASVAKNFPAKSWGGVVRDGPGMEHRKLASLAEGDPITVEESTGVDMNGYPWFKIRFGKDKIGYQWGGIICPIGQEMPGTYEKCD
ncbi:SH3 domain-containing protein [Rhizobium sp. 32-5/1]|uniref:SH3 domain-containing protein n=1 Tax=Rhizobium sp. 32-5/1 TaxID=3019602 RepID=UPI00240E251B|nr:SH3 domain-containing protein [Rhizobium sp. 32-5/1]WEZ82842.1 SH3 domain-containing protein [Rhizobium sp. 32-5/1]